MSRFQKMIFMSVFLMFMWHAHLYLKGSLAGRSVRTVPFTSGGATFDGRELLVSLSGSQDHSLAWDLDAAATLTVELGVDDGTGTFFFAPADLGFSQANPIVLGGADEDIIPLVIPVAQRLKITISGAANGAIIFSDS